MITTEGKRYEIREDIIVFLIVLVILGTSMNAFAFLGFGNSVSWKEEVLLHDGQKIIVERSQSYGGRHEIGQSDPVKEQKIAFSMPGTNEKIIWINEYGRDIGRANFELLALHILKDTPYIVTTARLCLSYNKWGRPNPPYVVFKYDGNAWRRILLEELPVEFTTLNLTIETKGYEKDIVREKLVTAERVRKLNNSLSQPEYKTILREPLDPKKVACKEMIRKNGGWLGIDWFSDQPSYEKCMEMCAYKKVNSKDCPCDRLFNKDNTEK